LKSPFGRVPPDLFLSLMLERSFFSPPPFFNLNWLSFFYWRFTLTSPIPSPPRWNEKICLPLSQRFYFIFPSLAVEPVFPSGECYCISSIPNPVCVSRLFFPPYELRWFPLFDLGFRFYNLFPPVLPQLPFGPLVL